MPNTSETAAELAALRAEFHSDMRHLREAIQEVKEGLMTVMAIRDDIAVFKHQLSAFNSEKDVLWSKVDQNAKDIKEVNDTLSNWKGRMHMAGAITALLGAIGSTAIIWTLGQVQQIPILVERLNANIKTLEDLERNHGATIK
jgi:methyl-accepting chemotaxis protein